MKYKNLCELLQCSSTGRRYFYALPTDVQLELSLMGEFIHDSTNLHSLARDAERVRRYELISRKDSSAE